MNRKVSRKDRRRGGEDIQEKFRVENLLRDKNMKWNLPLEPMEI